MQINMRDSRETSPSGAITHPLRSSPVRGEGTNIQTRNHRVYSTSLPFGNVISLEPQFPVTGIPTAVSSPRLHNPPEPPRPASIEDHCIKSSLIPLLGRAATK